MSNKLKLAEFCAGTGAFSYAFHNTKKVETIYANDFEKNSKKIFDQNFSIKLDCKDIHDLKIEDIPAMDIITSGFPCQAFSIAGQQKGFHDERSNVFWQLIKIISHHKPRFVIFENVKNLKSHDNGNTFKTITDEIEKIKYYYKYEILNTCKYTNIPQNRERIYIVCFREKDDYNKFKFDFIKPTEIKTLASMMQNEVDEKYYYTNRLKIWDEVNSSITNNISTGSIYQYRRYYVRENKNKLCPTLTANMGSGGHNVPLIKDNKGIRKLTPRECFNLQGFPLSYKIDNISDAGLYKLAGNAVSIPIVILVANKLMDIVEIDDTIDD